MVVPHTGRSRTSIARRRARHTRADAPSCARGGRGDAEETKDDGDGDDDGGW